MRFLTGRFYHIKEYSYFVEILFCLLESQTNSFHSMLKGDEKALKYLLEHYHNYLMVVGLRYLSDKQRVEDVIHDVFADLWNKNKKIELTTSVKSFFRGAVINKCLSIIRKDSRMEYVSEHNFNLSDKKASPDQIIDRDKLKSIIDQTINNLPDKCKAVFKLSRYEGKSHKEISAIMNISTKTIENHMTKALKTLKNELKRRDLLTIIFIIIKMKF